MIATSYDSANMCATCKAFHSYLCCLQGQARTVHELCNIVWQSQGTAEHRHKEAQEQQQRALAEQAHDVLAVLAGLGFVKTAHTGSDRCALWDTVSVGIVPNHRAIYLQAQCCGLMRRRG